MISNVTPDLLFSRNQPMKSVDGYYIEILKNKANGLAEVGRALKKTKETKPCDLSLVCKTWKT